MPPDEPTPVFLFFIRAPKKSCVPEGLLCHVFLEVPGYEASTGLALLIKT